MPRLVFVAHMDHPGFVARKMIDSRTLLADFFGGVLSDYVAGEKVRFFDGDHEIPGKVLSTKPSARRSNYPGSAIVRLTKPAKVTPGVPGMFDQGTGRTKGSLFYSRVCDDLGGVSSVLTMLDQLSKTKPQTTVCALLTRAEEDGFIGAIASALFPTLLKKSDRMISIETSMMQPAARQGEGVVLRVGDYTSIFNSSFMYFIHQQAMALKQSDKKFKFQRSLMPGGTCEATVFDAYGYVTGAICVALGNYHNMNRETKKIGPEYIDVNDWRNMVKLFVQLAKTIHTFDGNLVPLQKKIEKYFRRREKLLLKTASA
jgi:endoglucanase